MARSGPPEDGRVTSLRNSLQDPKHLVRRKLYEKGGHRVLSESTLWTALTSAVWSTAEELGSSEPSMYYFKPVRWVLIAEWIKLLDEEAVTYLAESMRDDVRLSR